MRDGNADDAAGSTSPEDVTSADNGGSDAALTEVVRARGHENVSAEHRSTFEVTTDDYLTPAGDCILGVEADRAPADFGDAFVAACRNPDARITATLLVSGPDGATDGGDPGQSREAFEYEHVVTGRGDPELTFEGDRSLVCRTSDYVDDRTVMLEADHGAVGVDRELVAALENGAPMWLELTVEP